MQETATSRALISNDAVILGLLFAILAFVFHTSRSMHPGWKRFYAYVPSLLLCYFIPGLLNTLGIIDSSQSNRPCCGSHLIAEPVFAQRDRRLLRRQPQQASATPIL